MSDSKGRRIGAIGNYYGVVEIKQEEGRYFWGIEDHSSIEWEEIPLYLYDSLTKFQDTKDKNSE